MAVIRCSFMVLGLWIGAAFMAHGAVLNYSGRIWVDGAKFNGTGHFAFSIADTNGVILWASGELPFEGSTNLPAKVQAIAVVDGVYRARIGDTASGMPLLNMDQLRETPSPRLHIWFNDGVRGWQRVSEVALEPALAMNSESTPPRRREFARNKS